MIKKKIYIAGKVTGLPIAQTSMKFGMHQKKLMDEGHEPVVPLELCDKDDTWESAMKKCIIAMLGCDEVHMLYDWKDSRGALLERHIASKLCIPIFYV